MTKQIKTVDMHDNFKCECGNKANYSGFFPCNEKGEEVEPDNNWSGLYVCSDCGQIYLPE